MYEGGSGLRREEVRKGKEYVAAGAGAKAEKEEAKAAMKLAAEAEEAMKAEAEEAAEEAIQPLHDGRRLQPR